MLKVEKLGKSYKGRKIVLDISLELARGETVGLLGPNGAGKTTSFYMIAGLVKPDYGRIYIDNYNITFLPIYKRARMGLSYLPQEPSIFRKLTVAENIMGVLEIVEPIAEQREKKLLELLEEFSITHLRNIIALSLSGGERRRVEIARCLATKPQYILLDEPLAGIDPIVVNDIKIFIQKLKQKGIGILITDHNVRDVFDTMDRVYIIYNGTVLAHGTIDEVVQNSDVRKLYLGEQFAYL